tara:strand:+ start:1254 stop:1925 length:672 start_codon:yes stop_codon:yes gene_type:complete
MSRNLKLSTSEDVETFLRILAEESTKKSKKYIFESTGVEEQNNLSMSITSDLKKYGETLAEEEDDENQSSDQPDEIVSQDQAGAAEEEPEEETLPSNITTTDIITLINFAREAPSTKDYKDQLSAYIDDILDKEERLLVYLFLDQITKIMHGSLRGAEAQDPSDPPNNFNIAHGNKTEPQKEPATQTQALAPQSGEPASEPPIRVGSQKVSEIRKIVESLMKS